MSKYSSEKSKREKKTRLIYELPGIKIGQTCLGYFKTRMYEQGFGVRSGKFHGVKILKVVENIDYYEMCEIEKQLQKENGYSVDYMFDKKRDDHKKKISESNKISMKGIRWFTNGIENKRCREGEQPDGFEIGRTL